MAHFILRDLVKGGRWALEVDGESFLIGRSRDADVCIRDTTVSKKHCQISRREVGTFRFKDLGSRNGTFINELRTNSGPIEDGDELRIGNFSIVFYRNAAPAGAGACTTPLLRASSQFMNSRESNSGVSTGDPLVRVPMAFMSSVMQVRRRSSATCCTYWCHSSVATGSTASPACT